MNAMLAMILAMWLGGDACAQASGQPARVTIQRNDAVTLAGGATVRAVPLADDDASTDDAKRPWLGVMLAPVPAPLAAHVGDQGLMIVNLFTDSPADKAGLERYDIIRSFNGKTVDDMEGLVEMVTNLGAGKEAELGILHGGQSRTVRVTLAERGKMDGKTYKYESLDDTAVDAGTALRGHTLRIGPDGSLQLEDLGPLWGGALPDQLKRFWAPGQGTWNMPNDLFGPGFQFHFDIDADGQDEQVQIRVQVTEDGSTTTVTRETDGKIRVERTDKDGKTQSAEYENEQQLREKDEAAWQIYSRVRPGGFSWRQVAPDPDQLSRARQRYQQHIEDFLREVQKGGAGARLRVQRDKDADDAAQAPAKVEQARVRTRSADAAGARSDGLRVVVEDDGRVEVTVTRDGQTLTYKFKDKADFQKREPDLYKRYEAMTR